MRAILALIALTAALFAQDNPAAGTWKWNAAKSTLTGPLPASVHNGILKIDRQIFTGSTAPRTPRSAVPSAPQPVYKFDLSPDAQTLTLTRPGSDPTLKLVFDRR